MTEETKKTISAVNRAINKTSALVIAKKIPTQIASMLLELCETIISLNRRIERLSAGEN